MNKTPIDHLLQTSKHVGTLKLNKPCLYIFPAQQGDSAYFALNGYSMLINGGYDRLKPCFWRFVNMLSQIDSVLVTHTDADALGGLASFFAKKTADPECKPAVLTVLGNLTAAAAGHHHQQHAKQATQLIVNEINATAPKQSTTNDVEVILDAIDKLKIKLMPLVKANESLLLPFNKVDILRKKKL